MMRVLRAAARFLDERVGWSRIGLVISLAIITVAAVVLYHMLQDIDVDDVIDALGAIPSDDVALAALFVAAAYFTLTFYDLFALRTVGHTEVPYRVAAFAALTSYAVGHNVGVS